MNRVTPAVLLIHLSPRFNFIGYLLAKSRASRDLYIPRRTFRLLRVTIFLIGAITIACTWYRAQHCIPKNGNFAIRLRLFLSRWLFLKAKISPTNEPRARNNSRGPRREICGVRFHFARGICNLKIFVQICLDATDVFLHFSEREM